MGHISIERRDERDSFYGNLRKDSLSLLQKLSGDAWTDYNLHDPGITILEQINYALWEFDYRLHFSLQDYLTSEDGSFNPSESLLFPPIEVFSVSPVTPTDYRMLIVSTVDDVADVKVIVNKENCTYDFVVDVFSDTSDVRKQLVVDEIVKLFHANRNLCENLGEVTFSSQIVLQLHADVEISVDSNPEQMLAKLYYCAQLFLNSGVSFVSFRSQIAKGRSFDELMEGPPQKRMLIDQTSLSVQGDGLSVSDLYARFGEMDGVKRVVSLFFSLGTQRYMDKLDLPDLYHSYSIVAFGAGAQNVRLTRNGKPVSVNVDEVKRLFQNYRYMQQDVSDYSTVDNVSWNYPQGKYLGKFEHEPIANGMPDCYGVNARGIAPSLSSKERDLKIAQLKIYLSWFDSVFELGLSQLNNLGKRMDGTDSFDGGWADLLDEIYGEQSRLDYIDDLQKENARLDFAKCFSDYGKNRGTGMNLLNPEPSCISGLELYVKRLVGIADDSFDLFLIEHPLFYYGMSVELPEREKFKVSVLFFAADSLLKNAHFCDFCMLVLKKRIPAHVKVVNVRWLPLSSISAFKTDFNFWKYILSTQKKLGAAELSEKIIRWINP